MEYREKRGVAPWVWVLIVLAALVLVMAIWWAVAAQRPEAAIAVTPEEEIEPPPAPPREQPPEEQPVVVERAPPVNIYIERQERQPTVVIVPKGEQPPVARERLRRLDLPGSFRYQSQIWEPSNQALIENGFTPNDTGASVDDRIVYVDQEDQPPYDQVYLETEPGSGIYVKYTPGA